MSTRTFNWLNLTRQYLKSLGAQGIAVPSYGTQIAWDNWFRNLSPRGNVAATLPPRNISAYYPNDVSALRLDGSNNVILWEDKSGNSDTNCLVLNANTSNFASFSTLTPFGTGDFTVVSELITDAIGSQQSFFGSLNTGFSISISSSGRLQSARAGVGNNTASNTTLAAFTRYIIAYVRSGTTATYYLNLVADGSITDTRDYTVGVSKIGNSDTSPTVPFGGKIFKARVYNAALNTAELLADANGIQQANCLLNIDFTAQQKLSSSFTTTVGGTITINTSGDTGARISGERDLYQGTAANRPAYTAASGANRMFLTFDGTNDYMKSAAFSLSQPESVYLTYRFLQTSSSGPTFYDGLSQEVSLGAQVNSTTLTAYAGTALVGNSAPLNKIQISSVTFNGNNGISRVNRENVITGAINTNNANGFTLGARFIPSRYSNISVSEIAIYSEASSTTTQNQIINYFASKYSIGL